MEGKSYVGGDQIGKTGIEREYEEILRGEPGGESVEVDARGRRVREIDTYPAGRGEDLHLTLDLGAQRLAADLLNGYRGALIVMDVHEGDVLVLASSPSYDNNPLSWGVSAKGVECAPLRPAEADARQKHRRALSPGVDLQDTCWTRRPCRERDHADDDFPLRRLLYLGKPYIPLLETFGARDDEPDGGASELVRRLFLSGWPEAGDYSPSEMG